MTSQCGLSCQDAEIKVLDFKKCVKILFRLSFNSSFGYEAQIGGSFKGKTTQYSVIASQRDFGDSLSLSIFGWVNQLQV